MLRFLQLHDGSITRDCLFGNRVDWHGLKELVNTKARFRLRNDMEYAFRRVRSLILVLRKGCYDLRELHGN